jgi:REP element-mobilizing transposase RayT
MVLPQRKHPIHPPPIDRQNRTVIIFLTVCTKTRQKILASPSMNFSVVQAWNAPGHWAVGRYVIMPDHIHLFCAPGIWPAVPLAGWVRHWKTRVCNATYAKAGTFWQRDFWDTQLRRGESYSRKWEYARNNPVRAGLVRQPEDWPYQGELNVLRWH